MLLLTFAKSWTLLAFGLTCCYIQRSAVMAEVYSALSHTQRIRDIELELNDALQDYIEEQETRLAAIKRFATEVKHSVDLSAEGSPGSYIGHPVNMYLMIKRFVNEWPQVEKVVEEQSNSEAFLLDRLASSKSKFPTSEDLTGAITAIKRLQEVYALKPVDFSEGRFGFKPKTGYLLGPKDTYKIGRESYLDGDMVGTAEWMTETLRLMDLGVSNGAQAPRRTDVLDHLAFAEFKNGDGRKALNHTLELIKIDPENTRAKNNLAFFTQEMKRDESKFTKKEEEKKNVPSYKWMKSRLSQDVFENFNWHVERDIYKRLCRGEKLPTSPQTPRRLMCWYFRGDPLCIIKPCKMERVFTNPDIVIFRDVITDKEVDEVRQISEPLLNRATVHNPITGHLETAHYRISKNCWLSGREHGEVIDRVERRIAAMTRLNLETAEGFQVQNYGLAGQYDPHFDFSRDLANSSLGSLGTGNRIATVLVWMSQVESGGATVFPYVGARILPQKGDAVFWHNLLRSGDGDFRTRHAGCPVLSGIKWVANKWIHEYGNEFHRPCSLRRDE
ncbi:prolyl 4-hydroxylase subunit alpha-2 [Nematostella vectensis]|uniref:prolyl 4-hydroxylase subunit alpha-2 n=1 Tax=Nematostella vectensis TaxID=45351 RepID=UPI0020777038|nr:prolyl 4-hydroxylase subunit alpha-2 [Nematostella vectensis]